MSNRANIAQVLSAFTATATKTPKVLTDAQDRANRVDAGIRALQENQPPSVTHAVSHAILEDRDPYADPAVIAAVVASQIGSEQTHNALRANAEEHLMDTFREHADDIVKAWRKPFDTAALDLAAAHERIGDHELDDSTAILKLGGDIATVWDRARTATATIDKILNGWAGLGMATGQASPNPRTTLLRFADPTPERFATEFDQRTVSVWQAVLADLPLSLPTFGEMNARQRAIEDYRQSKSDEAMKPARRQSFLASA